MGTQVFLASGAVFNSQTPAPLKLRANALHLIELALIHRFFDDPCTDIRDLKRLFREQFKISHLPSSRAITRPIPVV
jgi:hypothetical protein